MSAADQVEFRKCANVKSKTHPDSPCKNTATNGDFCARHWKRPHRYVALTESRNTYVTRFCLQAIRRIQTWWRRSLPTLSYKRQGPAVNSYTLSQNTTEVYSMEPLEKVPETLLLQVMRIPRRLSGRLTFGRCLILWHRGSSLRIPIHVNHFQPPLFRGCVSESPICVNGSTLSCISRESLFRRSRSGTSEYWMSL
jgi:hypothetical protein